MTVRTFTIGTAGMAVLASGLWLLIVSTLDPEQAGIVGYVLFFLTLFLAVASVVSLVGYGVRRVVRADTLPAHRVRNALRQGVLVSLFFNGLLLLVRLRIYRWWIAVILTIFFVSAELIFLSYDRSLRRQSRNTTP